MVNVVVRKLKDIERAELVTGAGSDRLPHEELKGFLCIELSGGNAGESPETLLCNICESAQVNEYPLGKIGTERGAVYIPLRQSPSVDAAYVVVQDDSLFLYTGNSQIFADTMSLFSVQNFQLARLKQIVQTMGRFEIGGAQAKAA